MPRVSNKRLLENEIASPMEDLALAVLLDSDYDLLNAFEITSDSRHAPEPRNENPASLLEPASTRTIIGTTTH